MCHRAQKRNFSVAFCCTKSGVVKSCPGRGPPTASNTPDEDSTSQSYHHYSRTLRGQCSKRPLAEVDGIPLANIPIVADIVIVKIATLGNRSQAPAKHPLLLTADSVSGTTKHARTVVVFSGVSRSNNRPIMRLMRQFILYISINYI